MTVLAFLNFKLTLFKDSKVSELNNLKLFWSLKGQGYFSFQEIRVILIWETDNTDMLKAIGMDE